MPVMIQIRDVPDTMHRELKVRALESGRSLSDFIKAEMEQLIRRPTRGQVLARLASRERVAVTADEIVRLIREDRESH